MARSRARLVCPCAALALALLGGCFRSAGDGGEGDDGGDSGPMPSSGLPRDAALRELDTQQAGLFCRWAGSLPAMLGEFDCDGSPVWLNPRPSEADCQRDLPTMASGCSLTVGEAERCLGAIARDPCLLLDSVCEPLRACGSMMD